MSHGIRFGVSGHAPHPGFEYFEVAAYCMEDALAIAPSGGPIWVHGPEPAQEDEFFEVLATLARISRVEFVNVHAGPADEEVECTNDACRYIWSRVMMPACPRCERGADEWCDHPSSSLSGICEALCEAQRQLSQSGKRLCVENGHESPALMARIFERLPTDIGFTLDVGHANVVAGSPIPYVAALGHRLSHLHLHDNHGGGHMSGDEHLTPQLGTIDWEQLAVCLAGVCFRGTATFECDPPSLDWLNKWATIVSASRHR